MSFAFTLPNTYGYVLLVATASTLVNLFHTETTAIYRRKARVPYPNAYATAVEASTSPEKSQFNSAQKAHAQFGEHHPTFLLTVLIAGLKYPQWATGLGAAWSVARMMYLAGYASKRSVEGSGRRWGMWWMIPHLGLMGLSFASAWKMVQ